MEAQLLTLICDTVVTSLFVVCLNFICPRNMNTFPIYTYGSLFPTQILYSPLENTAC